MQFRKVLQCALVGAMVIAIPLMCSGYVIQTRARAAKVTCQNNLKQIGLSIHNFAGTWRGQLPRTTAWMLTEGKQKDLPAELQASWLYEISPYVEARMDAKFRIDPTQSLHAEDNRYVVDSVSPVYLCSANDNVGPHMNFTHYVGITGVGRDAAMYPLSEPRCGFFGFNRMSTFDDIKDGTSTTLAVVETATDNGPWAIGGHGTARGLDATGTNYLGEHGQFGSCHSESYLVIRRFLGTNACFADGAVRVLSGDFSPNVFEAMATIAGGEAIPPDQ
jgi:hypothetical protein